MLLIENLASHEIRNPLSAVVQCADSIVTSIQSRNETLSAEEDSLFDEILDSAKTIVSLTSHQHRIVDDILTLSKLDSGMLPLALVPAITSLIVQDTLKMFEAELDSLSIKTSFKCSPSIEELDAQKVYCDPSRIRQILINLLTNAIKFTKEGQKREIVLNLSASLEEPSSDAVLGHHWCPSKPDRRNLAASGVKEHGGRIFIGFSVQDTGKGIIEEELKHLFNRFTQANVRTHINVRSLSLTPT